MSTSNLSDSEARNELLDQAIMEFLRAQENGVPLDIQDLLNKHSSVADELESFIDQQIQFGKIAAPVREFSTIADSRIEATIKEFGDYDIVREVGRGGMGVIYEARQKGLSRRVALKMIRDSRFRTEEDLVRFQTESEAAAALEHPNIVPVYRVGTVEGMPFFTMKLVRGGSLKEALENGKMKPAESARVALAIANGVSFAHQRGILHRDLKPANILLDSKSNFSSSNIADTSDTHNDLSCGSHLDGSDGSPVPMISDFGLAKQLNQDLDHGLTMTGAVLGTPQFMAPEQAAGKATTTSTDIYAVGAILYNMLTGDPPFTGSSPAEVTRKVIDQTPKLIGWKSKVDADLETICMKCLEKDPTDRYLSAGALAEDLESWLDGMPIRARRSSAFEQFKKWAARHPRFATLMFSSAALLILTLFGAIAFSIRVNAEVAKRGETLTRLRAQESETLAQRDSAVRSLFESKFAEVAARRSSGDNGQLFSALEAAKEAVSQLSFINVSEKEIFELRSETAGCLGNADIAQTGSWLIDNFSGQQINSFSPNLSLFVHHPQKGAPVEVHDTSRLNRVESIDKSTPVALLDIGDELNSGHRCQFSRCGQYAALNTWRWEGKAMLKTERVFDIVNSKTILVDSDVSFACFGERDSEMLLATSTRKHISIVRLPNMEKIATYENPSPSTNNQMSFSPNGKWLARYGAGGVFVIDITSGEMVWERHDSTAHAGMDLDWHPGGKEVVIAKQTYLQIWSLEPTPHLVRTFPRNINVVSQVEYAAGGSVVAASTWGYNTRFWDSQSGEQICSFAGTIENFSEDGISFGFSNVISGICQFDSGRSRRTISKADTDHMGSQPLDLDIHPNDRWVAMGSRKGVRICDLKTGVRLADLPGEGHVRFHPDGNSLFVGGKTLNRWPIKEEVSDDGRLKLTLGPPERVGGIDPTHSNFDIDIDPTGNWLAYIANRQATVLVNLKDRDAQPIRMRNSPNWGGIDVSANGRLVAVGNHQGPNGRVFDGATGELLFVAPTPWHVRCTLSPGGELLAVTYNSTADVYDMESQQLLYSLDEPDIEVAWPSSFSKDGELLLFTLRKPRGTLIVNARSGDRLVRIPGAAGTAPRDTRSLLTSDYQLVTIKEGNSLEAWDLATIRNRLSDIGLDWAANQPAVSTRDDSTAEIPMVEILWGESRWSAYEKTLSRLAYKWSWDVAEKSFNDWLANSPNDPDLWHAKAGAKSQLGDRTALRDISEAIRLSDDNIDPEIYFSRAKIGISLNERDSVVSDLISYLDLESEQNHDSSRISAVQMLAWEMGLEGKLQQDGRNALELAKTYAASIGQQELREGKMSAWLRHTFKIPTSRSLSPDNIVATKTLGLTLLQSGKPEIAKELLERIAPSDTQKLSSSNYGVGFLLAACEAKLGNPEKAKIHFESEFSSKHLDRWLDMSSTTAVDWSLLKSLAEEKMAVDSQESSKSLHWNPAELIAHSKKEYGTLSVQLCHKTNQFFDPASEDSFAYTEDHACNLFWYTKKPNQELHFELEVPTAGFYDGLIHTVHSYDYGQFEFELNGKAIGCRFDGQADKVIFGDFVDLDGVELRQGTNVLTVRNVGKSADSRGFYLGIESVEFTRK